MPPRPAPDTPSPASSSSSLPYSHFAAQMDKLSIEPRDSASSSSPSSSARASPAIGPSNNPYITIAQGRHSRKPSEISTSTSSSSSSSATPLPPPSSSRSVTSLHNASAHPKLRREVSDFEIGESIGEGSYSTVVAARDKHTGSWYAIKIEEKRHIIKEKKIKYVEIEKTTLNRMNHPGIVRLYWTFQDKDSLYFVLDLARNGELLTYIKKLGAFDMPTTQFYAAEILSAIEHVHSKGVIHRDVKPENILLDENMHIKLTDFGSAKILEASDDGGHSEPEKANSFVGTAEYVSPELLTDKSACKASDFWALGCIIYQLLAGRPPFKGANEYQTFQKIIKLEFTFPEGFPDVARDLVSRLLVLDPAVRLGAPETGGIEALKSHAFFSGVDWVGLFDSPAPKLHPYLPKLAEHNDTELRSKNEVFMRKSLEGKARDPFGDDEPEDLGEERARKINEQAESPWAPFLLKNELILRVGPVHKRKGLFNKKRVLILTDKPRLLYLDQEKMVQKGEIFWTPRMVPELKGRKHFFLNTPNKTYYFEDPSGHAQEWVDELNRTLLDSFGPTLE